MFKPNRYKRRDGTSEGLNEPTPEELLETEELWIHFRRISRPYRNRLAAKAGEGNPHDIRELRGFARQIRDTLPGATTPGEAKALTAELAAVESDILEVEGV